MERLLLPPFPWRRTHDATVTAHSRSTPWLIGGIACICLLTVLSLHQSSQMEAARQRIQVLRRQKLVLEQENAQLVRDISPWEGMDRIARRAQGLGFGAVVPEATVYLDLESLPDLPTEPPQGQITEVVRAPWQRWLEQLTTRLPRAFFGGESRARP